MEETQWGPMNYGQWCAKESERMNAAGGSTKVNTDEFGHVAIIRAN